MKTTAFALLTLPFLALACSSAVAEGDASSTDGSGRAEAAISDSRVKLPANDDCRDALAPLALGLADSAVGLADAKAITVSLTSETDTRLYTVSAIAAGYTARFEVELDNDSAFECSLLSAVRKNDATVASDAKTKLAHGEADLAAPITVDPAADDCLETVKLLANGAGVAMVGKERLTRTSVKLLGADENRYYRIHVDGKAFTVDGHTFENDFDFDLETSNDSASKCWVQDFRPTK